jgi:GNAT superfamily N-acetyltransferase
MMRPHTPAITVREERYEDAAGIRQALMSDEAFTDIAAMFQPLSGHYDILIAVDDHGTVLGMIEGHYHDDYADRIAEHLSPPQTWGSIIAVPAEQRRRGVGQALLAEFARRGRAAGSTYFVAKVSEHDDTTDRMAFFARCGLQPLMPDQEDDVVAGLLDDVIDACSGSAS